MDGLITRAVCAALVLAIACAAPAAAEPTQVLQAPSEVGAPEQERLTAILEFAGDTPVVLRVPGSASIDASDSDLGALAGAADAAKFYVVQQGDADVDGAAAILTAFADAGFRQPESDPPSGEPGEVWDDVAPLTGCAGPCKQEELRDDAPTAMGMAGNWPAIDADLAASHRPLGALLAEPAPGDGSGPELLLGGLLILLAGGLGAVALARARQRPEPEPPPPAATPPSAPPARRRAPAPGAKAPRPPTPTGSGRRAKVVSVLDPEGYVELDGCLQRARWASNGNRPVPGDWVDIETRGKRLWAYAAARPTNERRRSSEPH